MGDNKKYMDNKKMTLEKAIEIYEYLNGSLPVKFSSYYKYSFCYKGENNDFEIVVHYGGSADDIYRYSVDNELVKLPPTWAELTETYTYITITDKRDNSAYSGSFNY